jgi:hypothetical protein
MGWQQSVHTFGAGGAVCRDGGGEGAVEALNLGRRHGVAADSGPHPADGARLGLAVDEGALPSRCRIGAEQREVAVEATGEAVARESTVACALIRDACGIGAALRNACCTTQQKSAGLFCTTDTLYTVINARSTYCTAGCCRPASLWHCPCNPLSRPCTSACE